MKEKLINAIKQMQVNKDIMQAKEVSGEYHVYVIPYREVIIQNGKESTGELFAVDIGVFKNRKSVFKTEITDLDETTISKEIDILLQTIES